MLFRRHRLIRKHLIDSSPQVFTCHRHAIPRPASIELPAIHQPEIRIEKKNIRRAGSLESMRHSLCFVIKIREVKAKRLRLFLKEPLHKSATRVILE